MTAPEHPYRAAAEMYALGGWHPLPLPLGCKQPPPPGTTGARGTDHTYVQVVAAADGPPCNVALRMPDGVLGLDVDAYGGKPGAATLYALEREHGPLPPTWRSSARSADTASGIRFYRVPPGLHWDAPGPGIDAIQRNHRYAVVAPSVHPDGDRYRWYAPGATEPTVEVPTVEVLPSLPSAWVTALGGPSAPTAPLPRREGAREALAVWLEASSGEPCRHVAAVLREAERRVAAGESRHGVATRCSMALVRYAERGHPGVPPALDTLEAMTIAAASHDRPTTGEWDRLVTGAAARVLAEPSDDRSGCQAASDVFAPLGDDLFTATPLLDHIRRAAHHRLSSAEGLLGWVLARVLLQVPPRVVLPAVVGGQAALNLGVAMVGPAGQGKSVLCQLSREVMGLTWATSQEPLERNLGSGEGIAQSYLQWDKATKSNRLVPDPRRIFLVDEIDSLGATKSRNGSTVDSAIREALTGGSLGQENAAAERRRHVPSRRYRALLVVNVQPTRAAPLLDGADGGLPQRFVWLSAVDPTIPDEDVPWPGALDVALPELKDEIPYHGDIVEQIRDFQRAKARGEDVDPLLGHQMLTRAKVGVALALLHGETTLSLEWWRLAGLVMERSAAVQRECRTAMGEALAQQRAASGRLDAVREEGRTAAVEAKERQAAEAIYRAVKRHLTGHKDGNAQTHDPGKPCTARCVSKATQNLRPYREGGRSIALDEDWVRRELDGDREQWTLGESRPA